MGEARILFDNPKNRLLLVDDDGIYAGHVLREDVPEAEPDEAPLLPHVRRDCPTIGPDDSVAAALPLASDAVRQPARRGRRRRPTGGPALPQQARRLPLRGRPRMTGVHRSELTPVAFLQRAAYLHPGRVAVAHEDGRRITYGELEERCHRLANALRARGLRHGDRVAVLCAERAGACSRRTTPCRSPAACWSPSTRAWRRPRSASSCATPARERCSSITRSRRSSSSSTSSALDVVRIDDSGAAGRPLRAADRLRRARSGPRAGSSTRRSRSRSTTPRARPARPRASSTRTAARTSTRSPR